MSNPRISTTKARLKELAQSSGQQSAGCFSVRLSGAPASMLQVEAEQGLFKHAEIALDQALSEFDLWLPVGNGRYLIVFSKQDPSYASDRIRLADRYMNGRLSASAPNLVEHVVSRMQVFELERRSLSLVAISQTASVAIVDAQDAAELALHASGTVFEPVWDVSRGAVLEYVAGPASISGGVRFGEVDGPVARQSALATDLETVEAVVREVEALERLPGKPALSAKLHAASFATAAAADELTRSICRLDRDQRSRFNAFVYETRDGATARDVKRAADRLGPLARSIRLVTRLDDASHPAARQAGYRRIGLDLSLYDGVPERTVMGLAETFIAKADSADLGSFLLGVSTTSLASFSICTGAMLVSGSAVSEPLTAASPAVHYDIESLYAIDASDPQSRAAER